MGIFTHASRLFAAVAACLLIAGPALANSPIPGSAQLQRLHDVMNANPAPVKVPDEAIPNLTVADALSSTHPEASNVTLRLNSITVEGVTLYDPAQFMPIFDNVTGHDVSVAELFDLAQKITRTYRNDGYILARALIPPQDITAGHVTIKVVEGKLGTVHVATVDDASATVPIPTSLPESIADTLNPGVLSAQELETTMLRLNDLPGITATGTLAPGQLPGTSDLMITASEQDYSGSVGWSNWGTRFLGPNQLEGDISIYNSLMRQFDWYDELTLRAIQTTQPDELTYLDAAYKVPLNRYGTTLQLGSSFSRSEPGFTLEELDINSSSNSMELTIAHPLIRTRATNLSVFGTLDWNNSESKTFGVPLSRDKLRVARVGTTFDHADSWQGITNAKLELSHGLDIGSASTVGDSLISRTRGTGTDFWKARAELARLQRLHTSWNLLLAISGQFSSHALLAGEEFGVGGENFGRGYDVSEILGDHGVAAKAELQVTFPVGWEHLQSWQLFGFYDIGLVFNKDTEAGSLSDSDSLLSNGVGIRARMTNTLTADVTLANPLTRTVSSQGLDSTNPTVYMRLKKRFGGQW